MTNGMFRGAKKKKKSASLRPHIFEDEGGRGEKSFRVRDPRAKDAKRKGEIGKLFELEDSNAKLKAFGLEAKRSDDSR